ncbi:MAG TPA: hypothetical protein PK781_01965 [Terrimesophilobacter sp.]|nr:hypothetical protein [Terrimesophilobacter sp.]
MNRRLLAPLALAAALALSATLSACSGGPAAVDPADPNPAIPNSGGGDPGGGTSSGATSGGSATVILGDHTYEFAGDTRSSCRVVSDILLMDLDFVSRSGEPMGPDEGDFILELPGPGTSAAAESEDRLELFLPNPGQGYLSYVAGEGTDAPITLVRDGMSLSGTQTLVHRDGSQPPVEATITAQCDPA